MREGEIAQNGASGGCEPDPDFALVFGTVHSGDSATCFEPVHQLNCAVMLQEQARGDFADGRFHIFGKPVHGKEQLVLLRLDLAFARDGFADRKELANLAAKFSQIAVLLDGKISVHIYIVTRYKWLTGLSK